MTDCFSPAILPLPCCLELSSEQVMRDLGELMGRSAPSKVSAMTPRQMMDEFVWIWERHEIGELSVERENPLVLQVSDCKLCGQLQDTG